MCSFHAIAAQGSDRTATSSNCITTDTPATLRLMAQSDPITIAPLLTMFRNAVTTKAVDFSKPLAGAQEMTDGEFKSIFDPVFNTLKADKNETRF